MFHVYQHGALIGKSATLWGAVGICQRYSTYSFSDALRYDGLSVVHPDGTFEEPTPVQHAFRNVRRRTKAEKKAMQLGGQISHGALS